MLHLVVLMKTKKRSKKCALKMKPGSLVLSIKIYRALILISLFKTWKESGENECVDVL